MIRNSDKLKKFYEDLINKDELSHRGFLRIFDAWCKEADNLNL